MRTSSTILQHATRTAIQPRWRTVWRRNAHRGISAIGAQLKQAADEPDFVSVVDNPPNIIRTGRRHGPGLIILALIPITAFALGTWQVQRLEWKSKLIAKFEDRLAREPLPLPSHIDESAIKDFDYRRVYAIGHFRHDQEMLIGPRTRDGNNGYLVVTPLERGDNATSILVNRGWIPKKFKSQRDRPDSLPVHQITVKGLLREPWKRNIFTPENSPQTEEFYFPDVAQMANLTGSQPVWVEEIMEPNTLKAYDREARGIPIGRPAEVSLRNNHAQYIFTWYALAAATSVMLWMIVRKPPADISRRVRQNKEWR